MKGERETSMGLIASCTPPDQESNPQLKLGMRHDHGPDLQPFCCKDGAPMNWARSKLLDLVGSFFCKAEKSCDFLLYKCVLNYRDLTLLLISSLNYLKTKICFKVSLVSYKPLKWASTMKWNKYLGKSSCSSSYRNYVT